MRKINVRSPFYISGDQDIEPVILPDPYFYYTATECGGSTTVSIRSTTELTNGKGIKVNGYGDTCFEVTGVLTDTNETDVTFIYDTCDKCNGVPDYNYYSAELCSGGSPIDVRSIDTLEVGQVIKAENYSADCYTITGSGSSNTNTVVTLFNNCNHCETGIDYKYYDANSCDGTSSVVVRYEGTLPSSLPVINVSGQGDKCFVLDGETDETSTNDITSFYQNCTSCIPTDPYTYYTATECGGSATVDFKSSIPLAIGSSVNLDGYGTTCYQVTSVGSVSGIGWTNKYTDCTACANANDPYNYFYAQKCDGTGAVIKIASTNTLAYMKPRLWKASGQNDTCFSILSQTTSGGTVYNATAICPTCPKDDPYRYWKAIICGGKSAQYFRSEVDMKGKTVKFDGDDNCYAVSIEVFTPNTQDWSEVFNDCESCAYVEPELKDVYLLTKYRNNILSTSKTAEELNDEFKCQKCSNAVEYTVGAAYTVPMAVGHQLYLPNGRKNTYINGTYVSVSTADNPKLSVCNNGQVVFPIIYTFSSGVVTSVKTGTVNECYKLPTSPEEVELTCGASHTQGADAGRKLYNISAVGTGTFTTLVTGGEVPCRFILKWNGIIQQDTGYIGNSGYDDQLLAAGVSPGDINTSAVSSKNATLTFNKSALTPDLIQIEVYSPLVNDEYKLQVTSCPNTIPLPDFSQGLEIRIGGDLSWDHSLDDPRRTEEIILDNTVPLYKKNNFYECLEKTYSYDYASTILGGYARSDGFKNSPPWLYRIITTSDNYYNAHITHTFLDGTRDYLYRGFFPEQDLKWSVEYVRRQLAKKDISKTYMIIYLVDPEKPGDEHYNFLVNFMNGIFNNPNPLGLKDLAAIGRLRLVTGIKRQQSIQYYRDVMVQQSANIGLNLNCG
jgi:hypothetical protein